MEETNDVHNDVGASVQNDVVVLLKIKVREQIVRTLKVRVQRE